MFNWSRHVGVIGWIGIAATLGYAIVMAWFVDGRWADIQGLKLNELGDFLAGVFGPLAILWLVLGFFQQGIELKQNSEALHLQAAELKNSVEQQTELVRVAQAQLEADKAAFEEQRMRFQKDELEKKTLAQPRFDLAMGGGHSGSISRHDVFITNIGAPCSKVAISTLGIVDNFIPSEFIKLDKSERVRTELTLERNPPFEQFFATLSFFDMRGDAGEIFYRMRLMRGKENYLTLHATEIKKSEIPVTN
ncbi:hypothetical protein [Acidovorax sp. NCPPB 3576]|uniref:hypothetical protein n=1 Tax=Acidovorax sp. NCPPB 3576 TaxID=2940488 RepID=UPI0023491C7C|nr:hypothetical protein [Acidovorax sp. NCPPB 3576]WCM86667.1 hypothetical protein M5C98_14900 [Acidovorax sp. NCPPB 3576]